MNEAYGRMNSLAQRIDVQDQIPSRPMADVDLVPDEDGRAFGLPHP